MNGEWALRGRRRSKKSTLEAIERENDQAGSGSGIGEEGRRKDLR